MDNKEVVEKISGFEKFLKMIMAKLKIKALMLSDVNGNELEFPELTDASELKQGVKVTAAGAPAQGEFQMPDGTILVCEAGVVNEIKAPAPADDNQALKDKIAALEAENESLKAAKAEAETVKAEAEKAVNEVKAEFTKFKAQFSAGDPADGNPPAGDPDKNIVRKPFKIKE